MVEEHTELIAFQDTETFERFQTSHRDKRIIGFAAIIDETFCERVRAFFPD
jgi:hypothetical protein